VLLLAFYLLVKVKMYSQAMDYTTLCRYVMGSEMSLADDTQLLDGMDTPCPGMLRRGGGGGSCTGMRTPLSYLALASRGLAVPAWQMNCCYPIITGVLAGASGTRPGRARQPTAIASTVLARE
jgi:hypothetical protein